MKQSIPETITLLFQHMGISSPSVSIETDTLGTVYGVETSDSRLFLGNNGEALIALNHIVKRIVEKPKEGEFSVDVNNYQKNRNDELRAKARVYAERAKAFQSDVEMDSMSSYEHMVVHAALMDDPNIKTESKGTGRERKVVVKYVQNDG